MTFDLQCLVYMLLTIAGRYTTLLSDSLRIPAAECDARCAAVPVLQQHIESQHTNKPFIGIDDNQLMVSNFLDRKFRGFEVIISVTE